MRQGTRSQAHNLGRASRNGTTQNGSLPIPCHSNSQRGREAETSPLPHQKKRGEIVPLGTSQHHHHHPTSSEIRCKRLKAVGSDFLFNPPAIFNTSVSRALSLTILHPNLGGKLKCCCFQHTGLDPMGVFCSILSSSALEPPKLAYKSPQDTTSLRSKGTPHPYFK